MAESSSGGTADIQSERLTTEISLLEAMYPGRVQYNDRTREVQYSRGTSDGNSVGRGGSLTLRIPSTYLADALAATTSSIPQTDTDNGFPEILTARDTSGNDIRTQTRKMMKTDLELRQGEEVLDQILMAFDELVDEREGGGDDGGGGGGDQDYQGDGDGHDHTTQPKTVVIRKTVIIWLHHLLATSKRKLVTSPTSLSGISKPGYPGILIYSGPTELVDAHVRDLRALKWQAFQVRWDSVDEERHRQDQHDEDKDMDQEARDMTTEWEFTHGKGKVVEVATMADLVGAIVKETHRQVVLKVLGVK
ncbi:hypothetical protein PV10_06979, partial [Exophiala mesophila]